jgi:hypothetical protein
MNQASNELTRKPYQPPKLLVYGNLAEMTKSLGNKGKRDGPGGRPAHRRTGA